MSYSIKIERFPYEEPDHLHLEWEVSNGRSNSCFEYYCGAKSLLKFADGLEYFPKTKSDDFLFEIGSETSSKIRWAYYFKFRVYVINSKGSSAIHIRFNNNRDLPYKEILEFCIISEPAILNRLGKLFREFSKLEKNFLVWSETENFIGDKYEYGD